ncbi:MAG: TrbC/VirB2 family protein [Candidatus Buchananbacteria bacterium]
MKKIATLLTLAVVFSMTALPVLALDTGIEYGTFTGLGTNDIREGVMNIVNVLLGFLGILAIIIILWGGFRWMTSGGNEEKVGEAKKVITAGIIGLIIIFTAYAIATFVISQMLAATGAV